MEFLSQPRTAILRQTRQPLDLKHHSQRGDRAGNVAAAGSIVEAFSDVALRVPSRAPRPVLPGQRNADGPNADIRGRANGKAARGGPSTPSRRAVLVEAVSGCSSSDV